MSLDLTTQDLIMLERHRLERLRSLFGDTLRLCYLQLDRRNCLKIHCSEAWLVDELMADMTELRWYVWIVVGAQVLSLCFAGEEVYRVATHKLNKKSCRRDRRSAKAMN